MEEVIGVHGTAWQASARLATRLRISSAGGMLASTGSCSTGVGCKHPVTCTKGAVKAHI